MNSSIQSKKEKNAVFRRTTSWVLYLLLVVVIAAFSTNSLGAQTNSLPPPPGLFDGGGVASEKVLKDAEVKTESGTLISRVAPGEFLPLSIKLLNFGGGQKVDVIIEYKIFDKNGNTVLSENETVAVETTASFVKLLQIPLDAPSGEYVARSSILYQDQVVPATAQFSFTVERKIAGIFLSQFILYSGITLLIGVAFAVVSRLVIKRRRTTRFSPHDYSNISKDKRLFFELISDTIMQMRRRVGDEALDIAMEIKGLKIDEEGRVLTIQKSPSKIIALLVLAYEKSLGQKVSFSMRQTATQQPFEVQAGLKDVHKNVGVVRKYFE